MWNGIAHIKQQFGFIFCGFGDVKQLKLISEERIDFLNSWVVKYIVSRNLCELNQVHRFNECNLLQDVYRLVKLYISIITQTKNTTYVYVGLIRQ